MPAKDKHIVAGLRSLPIHPKASVVSIGVFDGVHIGHQTLLKSAVAQAKKLNVPSIVLTFDPDPHDFLNPGPFPNALMPVSVRCRLIRELGIDWVVVIRFTDAFARKTAEDFMNGVLVKRLNAQCVIVGKNFRFGAQATGSVAVLRQWAKTSGVRIMPMEPVKRQDQRVSSSRIRKLVRQGDLAAAKRLVGRPPELYGYVVRGEGRGRELGTPTANIALNPQTVPPQGVYAVTVDVNGRLLGGVMNYGTRPTFCEDGSVVCEVHLFGFSGDLYGQSLVVSLIKHLRDERNFSSSSALQSQIARDISRAKRVLNKKGDSHLF